MNLTNENNNMKGVTHGKERDSNMELLRIIAMFLVLVVHADFFSLGSPTLSEIKENELASFTRITIQAFSIGCVNMFVLLSGWYGIRPKLRGFLNLVFQCLFYLVGIYCVCLLLGISSFNLHGVAGCFLLLKWNWFIRAYMLLYILAPLLNAFVSSATEKQLRVLLISFFTFQTIYSWLSDASVFFEHGYSTISFIGLYLLAQYLSKYKTFLSKWSSSSVLFVFLIATFLLVLLYYVGRMFMIWRISSIVFKYDNPIVIVSSLSMVLFFSKLKIKSNLINWVAASSFAVFLLHTNPNLCKPYFVPFVKCLYLSNSGIPCLLYVLLFLVFVFIISILIDQIRLFLWRKLAPFVL